jgi:glycerol uptake facilitator-like aquaporin
MTTPISTRLLAEFIGTALLLIAVVGSGIMAERLSDGNVALALLANAVATGAALYAIILAFGPISGAHLNPVVTLTAAALNQFSRKELFSYIMAQITGALAGVWLAHAMFALPIVQLGTKVRTGFDQWLAEVIATLGLLIVIQGCRNHPLPATAAAVGAYITGAYWFTASTSFANPAVTLARSLSDTFAGIRPYDTIGFIAAQIFAAIIFIPISRRLFKTA